MKILAFLTLATVLQQSFGLMMIKDFQHLNLARCYDTNMQDFRSGTKSMNGQVYPLPNSVETFISIVERYESLHPNVQVRELTEKLLRNFRMDDLHPEMKDEIKLRDTSSFLHNRIKRLIFSIPDGIFQYGFEADDFTEDEKCALTFMLSHTINDTVRPDQQDAVLEGSNNKAKEPRENGVVSLHSKPKHAFALGRVLLGIYAANLPSVSEDAASILSRDKKTDDELRDTKINPVYAVTIADLITRLTVKEGSLIYPNGLWSDVSCPLDYKLKENNNGFISYSELRGGLDGLLIGRKIQESRNDYANLRLSQILRMYYGQMGQMDASRIRWCNRETNLQTVTDLEGEMLSYFKLYKAMSDQGSVGIGTQDKIRTALGYLRTDEFRDVETDGCGISDTPDKKYTSPRNIFAILDISAITKLNLQTEIIGNLSSDFDTRPRGNLMGVYSNLRPLQQNTLDIIAKNSGTAGCPACYAKYFKKTGNKQDEYELFRDLNDTLTTFDEEQRSLEEHYQSEIKAGSPGKIVLYFNFGSSSPNFELNQALWELRRYFGGATILAIGDNTETLRNFVSNDQTDIFTVSPKIAQDLKQRINKVPAEFTYRECYQSTQSREADNKQEGYIGFNKIQYWAMYPQYFLKSHGIKLKFKSQDGAQIRVCFSRSYSAIVEGKTNYCFDSSGTEVIFYENDPCKKRNVYNCEPFYFSIEGKKQSNTLCQSLRCSSINDIQFQFEHEGISCNFANYVSVSSLAFLFAAMIYYLQRQ